MIPATVPSPCIGLCRIDEASRLCAGCARSTEEIAFWKHAPAEVREQVWSALPARRRRLGIGLHRLEWTVDRIQSFVVDSLQAGAGTWVLGMYGAVAEFCVGPDEACDRANAGGTVSAQTPRGGIRFDLSHHVRALALTTKIGDVNKEVIVLTVLRSGVRLPAGTGLTNLGPDRDALRTAEQNACLFDLGLGATATRFCIRTSDADLTRALGQHSGARWTELLAGLGGAIVAAAPTRVVLGPIGRVEVCTPIPLPNGRSPDGPHTHLLPAQLAAGRELPPGFALPEVLMPCAIFYPSAGPAETDECHSAAAVSPGPM